MTTDGVPRRWVVVLAVKPLSLAKSRLDRPDRSALTLAMAADTATAAAEVASVEAVLVVTDDDAARHLLSPVAVVVPDSPGSGLNPALTHAAAEAWQRWPHLGVVVLAPDLPALRPGALGTALSRAAGHPRAFVADAGGTGTVLLSAAPGVALAPAFGQASHRRHLSSGAIDITSFLPPGPEAESLRRDVDTATDLAIAVGLGVGPLTARALAAAGPFTSQWQTSPVSDFSALVPGSRPGS